MTHSVPAALMSLTLVACAGSTPCPESPATQMPPSASVDLAPPAPTDQGMQVAVLIDEPVLKVLSITLRGGTVLPEHTIPAPVLIQAIAGSGVVVAGGQELSLETLGGVLLAPNTPHTVRPTGDEELVLQVQQHLGSSR